MSDPIDDAIAATERPVSVTMGQLNGALSNGRPFAVALPVDMTDGEMLEVLAYLAAHARNQLAEAAGRPPGRLPIWTPGLPI